MIEKGGIWVIDDFIDLSYQEQIKNVLMGDEEYADYPFPWHFIDDVTDAYSNDNQGRAGMSHVYVELFDDDTSEITSDFHDLFINLLNQACYVLEVPTATILQGRSFLQFPYLKRTREDDTPHIDLEKRHVVVLYYVCDADGHTVIYNEREKSDVYTVKQKVSPKQGRVVIFDGGLFHTAQQPENKIRCVVNYNLG
tara:strand:- start:7 stop:594 length:588 start_codon:yes stop_codon:yes gene_type:complete